MNFVRCPKPHEGGSKTQSYRTKENLAFAKIVKIEFNTNLDLLGFPHFYNIQGMQESVLNWKKMTQK